ncbi:hypothetical protein CGZ80_18320 [Rhodopirellula sp. MGV]|nr:hypothetical protein CGZ80_18320 [Rhodopirellula sp. MGV]PNY35091.1 hypothetical protein C2E31_19490 [Rhodopirellula baltica]
MVQSVSTHCVERLFSKTYSEKNCTTCRRRNSDDALSPHDQATWMHCRSRLEINRHRQLFAVKSDDSEFGGSFPTIGVR